MADPIENFAQFKLYYTFRLKKKVKKKIKTSGESGHKINAYLPMLISKSEKLLIYVLLSLGIANREKFNFIRSK